MKFVLKALFFLLATSAPAFAETAKKGVNLDAFFEPISNVLTSVIFYKVSLFGNEWSLIVCLLISAGLYCTLYMGFINIRGFKHAVRLAKGDYHDSSASGEVSHFGALCSAISGSVGMSNIAGVPIAIMIGGPGAIFWMIFAAFIGMSSKFTECTLATKYRTYKKDGTVKGGPMYYLSQGLAARGKEGLGKFIGKFYAWGLVIGCLGIGNLFQSNQIYNQLKNLCGNEGAIMHSGWLVGLIGAIVVGIVIIGGMKRIAAMATKIVPMMVLTYIALVAVVLVLNGSFIIPAIKLIITDAFTAKAAGGGIAAAMMIGFQRAAFSNECGIGTAAIAHSAVQTDEPVTEGFVSMIEPFIDTIVVQFATALVVVTTMIAVPEYVNMGLEGMSMSSWAFERHFSFAVYPLTFAAILFGFTCAVSWAYYGLKAFEFIFGEDPKRIFAYNVFYCLVYWSGAMINLKYVVNIADALIFVVAVPNIIGLYIMAPEVKAELNNYMERIKSGKILPAALRNAS
ncbi:MAG: alanine:cation symporter family protein [Desulfobacterales bacterium]|nr:alanine:cation symporter family protein [Desulfobacterales bacterium]